MRLSAKSLVILGTATLVVAALVWLVVRDTGSEPYTIQGSSLSGWTVVVGAPTDPWVVALQPPAALTDSLFQQLSRKAGRRLVAVPHALPLVLRGEYEDALQGVNDTNAILRFAQDELPPATTFEAVCLAHHTDPANGGELFFVAFNSAEFWKLRGDLVPAFPEHAGIGVFDPGAQPPILPLAATDADFGRWWPLQFEQLPDCQAQLVVR